MAQLRLAAGMNTTVAANGALSRGAVIGIGVGAGAVAVLLVAAAVALIVRCCGKGGGGFGRYYAFDFGESVRGSVDGLRATIGAESTIALRGGPSQKSVLRLSIASGIGRPSRRERGARPADRAAARGRGMQRNGSVASVASDDGIAAPELPENERIGGSGVGFLDERGNPIVRRHSSFEAEREGEGEDEDEENGL